MADILDPVQFTDSLVGKLSKYDVQVSSPEPLSIKVAYGANEPELMLNLKGAYDQYSQEPGELDALMAPVVTEVGWTINGTHYAFSDIEEHSLPLMRDLLHSPFTAEELGEENSACASKGPLVYQDLVARPEEHIIVQFVLAKNELLKPLYTGDMLRSYPDPPSFSAHCVQNLRLLVLKTGLTLSEYPVENFQTVPWLVGLRGTTHRQFLASMITVPEVMRTLEQTVKANDGLVAILPSREQLLVCNNSSDAAVEMGLLARYLRQESSVPVSGYIWHFKDGSLTRVQMIETGPDEPAPS